MTALLLAILFAGPAWAQNPPYTITETKTGRDAAALNQDLRALSDAIRKTDATARLLTSSVAATVADFVRTGGTHTLSGTLTFNGPVTGTIHRSTIATFGPVDITISGASFQTYAQISTLTFTMNGGRARMVFNCEYGAGPGNAANFSFLVDGSYVDGGTSTIGFGYAGNGGDPAQGTQTQVHLEHVTDNTLSAGSHSFAFVAYGAGTLEGSTRNTICQFYVQEFF